LGSKPTYHTPGKSLEVILTLSSDGLTLLIIPASARAMYAPREYPSRKMSDHIDDDPEKKNKNATEETNFITAPVILHEKHVSIDYMLTEVPREPRVKILGNRVEERRNSAGLNVGADAGLRKTLSWVDRVAYSGRASTFLVITQLRLWIILVEHGEKSDYIGILRDVNRINDVSEFRWW
jgi:hypothetical protein